MSLEKILKSHGYSLTKARKEVFNLLKTADRPMSISEVIKQSPALDRATVYRTITLFDELAITKYVWFGSRSKIELSEDFVDHHHHIVCQSCGRIENIDQTVLEKNIIKASIKTGYKIIGHHIEVLGLCADCQTNTFGKS